MTRRLVVISAGLSDPSSTTLLAERLSATTVAAFARDGEQVEVEHVELRPLAHDVTNHLLTGFANGTLAAAQRSIAEADAVIAVTPVFTASYSGLFKSFVDVLDRDALSGTPVLIAATAGTARHSLVLEHALRPLFSHLRALVVPTAVFAASDDWGGEGGADGELSGRIDRAAGELATLTLTRAPRSVTAEPGAPSFEGVRDFESLLADLRPEQ